MNKKIPKVTLTLLVVMLISMTFSCSMPAFAEPKTLSKQMFDKLVATETLDPSFDYILKKYCQAEGKLGRSKVLRYAEIEEQPILISDGLYILLTKDNGYLFDRAGYYSYKALKEDNQDKITRDKQALSGFIVLLLFIFFSLVLINLGVRLMDFLMIPTFLFLIFIIFARAPYGQCESTESIYSKTALNYVSVGELGCIQKLRTARVRRADNAGSPDKEIFITSGDETERATVEVTRTAPGNYHSEVKEVVIEKKNPGEVKAMAEYLLNAGYEVEISANGNVLIRNKHSK